MPQMDRIPAIPLIANDPYFSVWAPADTLNEVTPIHWTGVPKPMGGHLCVDGREYRYLGKSSRSPMTVTEMRVTPTQTISTMEAAGVRLEVRFWSPALPKDLDALSTPITFVDYTLSALDGKTHEAEIRLNASSMLCYDGQTPPPMTNDSFRADELNVAYVGQKTQHVLGHSGDHITMDWGYLYMAAQGDVKSSEDGVNYRCALTVGEEPVRAFLMLGYDDIAAVNYFGDCCKAWYMRKGATLMDAFRDFFARHDALHAACEKLDKEILNQAKRIGGKDYALIAAAAWRHTFAAHKLIATPKGEMAFLSKENDSNGCIGTVDVSYPSIPLFLKFCPELVNAMCRPVLEFAMMPVWEEDFAPHDVGCYPYATGQVYACRRRRENGVTPQPFYMYPAGSDVYDIKYQMPVEECGNMLIMMETAVTFGAKDTLVKQYAPLLEKWVNYLDHYGDDPGEQLCTDDFAGHLAHNVNLSAKAVVGIACYARLLRRLGRDEEAAKWDKRAHEMAQSWLERAKTADATALTFDGIGWSMKYNLVWDRVLGLNLLDEKFYQQETESYIGRMNEYGLPLDSRADYTKSDWMVWVAAMSENKETFRKLIAPLAYYLRNTKTRLPFSDWYDTKTGRYVSFIGRSVQGGLYMPLLMKKW